MKIKVKFINGNNSIYETDESDILSLKKLIADEKDTTTDNLKLIYSGKILKNEDTFLMHNIDENSTLHCVVRKNQQASNTVEENTTNTTSDIDTNQTVPNLSTFMNNLQNQSNNINDINSIITMYQIPQFRELVISSTLNRMNLPIDSPFRHVIDNNINILLNNPQMANQVINNMNNMNNINNTNDNLNNFMNMFETMNNSNQNNFINMFGNANNQQSNISSNNENTTANNDNVSSTNISELRDKYKDELEEVKVMGFTDEELILNTLNQSHGSVVITINKLLG